MPRLAGSLKTLLAQVDARYPGRSKKSDGWIASGAHLTRTGAGADKSQHNPNRWDVVCAVDITEDLAVGLDCMVLLNELDALDDPRFVYGIHDGQIENSNDTRTPYKGSSPHTLHLHVSVVWTDPDLFDDIAFWQLPSLMTTPTPATPEETDMGYELVFVSDAADRPWWKYDGMVREYVPPGWPQVLVDLGRAQNVQVKLVHPNVLAAMPIRDADQVDEAAIARDVAARIAALTEAERKHELSFAVRTPSSTAPPPARV